jgi:hypothetical protein
MRTVWTFDTTRFRIALQIEPDYGYQYDGDDEDGETQAKLDSGEYVAFDSRVVVYLDDNEIASDALGGSVYAADDMAEFWTAHRDPNPMNRNCSIMRAAHGGNVCICHYFPDMVHNAVREARAYLCSVPPMRCAA